MKNSLSNAAAAQWKFQFFNEISNLIRLLSGFRLVSNQIDGFIKAANIGMCELCNPTNRIQNKLGFQTKNSLQISKESITLEILWEIKLYSKIQYFIKILFSTDRSGSFVFVLCKSYQDAYYVRKRYEL